MRRYLITTVMILSSIGFITGCHEGPGIVDAVIEPATRQKQPVPSGYNPVEISILPITAFIGPQSSNESPHIQTFISLKDSFGCPIKSPGRIRFELCKRVPHSGNPIGKQLCRWPDIDLIAPQKNHHYWRDFLRAYEFQLSIEPGLESIHDTILVATFLSMDSRRLTAEHHLKQND